MTNVSRGKICQLIFANPERPGRFSPGPRKGAVEYRAEAIARSRAFHISAIDPPAFVSAGYEQIRFGVDKLAETHVQNQRSPQVNGLQAKLLHYEPVPLPCEVK